MFSPEEASDISIQETEKEETSSKQVIAGNPVNFYPCYGSTKKNVSSAYVTLCSLLEKHANLEVEVRQQLLELKCQLESATDNINTLGHCLEGMKLQNEQENGRKAEEISSLSEKLEQFKNEQLRSDSKRDVRIDELELKFSEQSTDFAKVQQQLQLIEHKVVKDKATVDKQREEVRTVTMEDNNKETLNCMSDDEAEQQMKERRQKRLSGHLEDSLEKMREFASTKPRQRVDSGISINSYNSVTGLVLQDESGSGMSSVPAQQ